MLLLLEDEGLTRKLGQFKHRRVYYRLDMSETEVAPETTELVTDRMNGRPTEYYNL